MNILAMFNNFGAVKICAFVLLTVFCLVIWAIKLLCLNKKNILDISLAIIIFFVPFFIDLNKAVVVIFLILASLNLLYSLFDLVTSLYIKNELDDKTVEYVKNTEYDFFIQLDPKDHITDCSSTFLKLTKLSKKEVLKNQGWKLIFDSFNVKSINKEEFTLNYVAKFLNDFKECNSKHKKYKFQMDVEVLTENKEIEIVKYEAIVQPVFCGKYLVGRNVFFYQDRICVVEELKNTVRSACTDLEDAYLQLDVMMGMSEGVVMYYDFQNKVYVATECMRLYTKTNKKEYSFEEIFTRIHPDDVRSYIEQAETVNSLSITKLKYRLLIGDIYYQVEEDSIYMRKDYGLISIIRIAEKSVYQSAPKNAKIINELEILDDLSSTNISNTIDQTSNILDSVLDNGEENDD